MTDKIIDKIRKLMALAGDNANESESQNALEMASALMMQHGIEEGDLNTDGPKVKWGNPLEESAAYHRYIQLAVSGLMGCRGGTLGQKLVYLGRPENTRAAEELHVYAILQVEELYKRSLPKGLTQKQRSHYRKNFKLACSLRLVSRALEIVENQGLPGAASDSRALVVNHRAQLEQEIEDFLSEGHLKAKSRRVIRPSGESRLGVAEGRAAGDQVELAKGLGQ